jgi:hypothetical protein
MSVTVSLFPAGSTAKSWETLKDRPEAAATPLSETAAKPTRPHIPGVSLQTAMSLGQHDLTNRSSRLTVLTLEEGWQVRPCGARRGTSPQKSPESRSHELIAG